jgi:hypothetical protein
MESITEGVVSEVARAEIRLLKHLGAGLHERIGRLEYMVANSRNVSTPPEQYPTLDP